MIKEQLQITHTHKEKKKEKKEKKKKDQNAFRFLSKKICVEKRENCLLSFLRAFTVAKQTQEAKRKMSEKSTSRNPRHYHCDDIECMWNRPCFELTLLPRINHSRNVKNPSSSPYFPVQLMSRNSLCIFPSVMLGWILCCGIPKLLASNCSASL